MPKQSCHPIRQSRGMDSACSKDRLTYPPRRRCAMSGVCNLILSAHSKGLPVAPLSVGNVQMVNTREREGSLTPKKGLSKETRGQKLASRGQTQEQSGGTAKGLRSVLKYGIPTTQAESLMGRIGRGLEVRN